MDRKIITSKEIGKMILDKRKAVGLSQVALAKMMGVNKRTMCAYEKGERRIHAALLIEIAKVLKISLDHLTETEKLKIDYRTKSAHIFQELQQLPEADQSVIHTMIDSLSSKKTTAHA